jgi:RHS repeat-associated protein
MASTQDLATYRYELSNHLGNTLTTFTGRKLDQGNIGSEVSHYEPEIVSLGDYDPFGVELYGRSYNNAAYNGTSGYRYGFNGKELDKSGEWGSLTQYDYGFRIYNPSIAKFLSVDPLTSDYAMLTPYQFASNRPIDGVDLDGKEYYYFMSSINTTGQKTWTLVKTQDVIKMVAGVGDISMKLSKYGITGHFAYYNSDCSWRLVPNYFTQFSLNNITDEQWQSFTTIDEIESKVKSNYSIGQKAELALFFTSIFDAARNINQIRRVWMNKWRDLGSSVGSKPFRVHELDGIFELELKSGRKFKPSSNGKGDFEDVSTGSIIDHLGIGDGF